MEILYRPLRRAVLFSAKHFTKGQTRLFVSPSFRYEDLRVNLSVDCLEKNPPDFSSLKFGKTFSDHMFQVEWTEGQGWGTPMITPLHFFQMHPGAKVLHYAQGVFEGMKCFKSSDNKVGFFRPDLNMKRLVLSAERASLPTFDWKELLKCIAKLVSVDKRWVPYLELSSLYIRPTYIGIEGSLGVSASTKALLYVVTCPVGPYFDGGTTKPVSLLADPRYVRAFPGGVGGYKLAANYAPTLSIQKKARDAGMDQVLWLFGEDYQIAEAGAMNVFFFLKNEEGRKELVTPPLDGTILPGVTRQSILDLTRDWKEFKVSERKITMGEVIAAQQEHRLLEAFMCGTAAVVCPVSCVQFKGERIDIPYSGKEDQLYMKVLNAITEIQYGVVESEWFVPIDKYL